MKRYIQKVMAVIGWTPTADCAAEAALADKRLTERQDQLDQAIDERDTARTLAELIRGDVARLERERDEALTAAEIHAENRELMTRQRDEALVAADIHQSNRELWEAKAEKLEKKLKAKGASGKTQELAMGRGTARSVAKKRKAA